jgi:hypothetical protein
MRDDLIAGETPDWVVRLLDQNLPDDTEAIYLSVKVPVGSRQECTVVALTPGALLCAQLTQDKDRFSPDHLATETTTVRGINLGSVTMVSLSYEGSSSDRAAERADCRVIIELDRADLPPFEEGKISLPIAPDDDYTYDRDAARDAAVRFGHAIWRHLS